MRRDLSLRLFLTLETFLIDVKELEFFFIFYFLLEALIIIRDALFFE